MARVARTYDTLMRRLGYDVVRHARQRRRRDGLARARDARPARASSARTCCSCSRSRPGDPAEFEKFGPKEYAALEFLGWFQSVGGYNQMNGTRPADHRGRAVRLAGRPAGLQRAVRELRQRHQPGLAGAGADPGLALLADQHHGDRGALPLRREAHAGAEPQVSHGRTGVAVFEDDFQTIRPLAERDNANIVHWSEFDRGGHYAALEVPELVVGDLRVFFAQPVRPRSRSCAELIDRAGDDAVDELLARGQVVDHADDLAATRARRRRCRPRPGRP